MKPRNVLALFFLLLIIAPGYAAVTPTGHNVTFINDCTRQVGIVFDESNYDQSTSHLPSCKPRQTDPPLCYTGQECGAADCCPPLKETALKPYNCPGIKHKGASCPNATPYKSGYENASLGRSPAPCSGPVLGPSVNGSFMLNAGENRTILFPAYWNGAFFTRTDCTFDSDGYGNCLTGDCTKYGWGYKVCAGAPSIPPATKGEFNFDLPAKSNKDWYDVSYVNGFNIAMVIEPTRYDPSYPGSDTASAGRLCTPAGCAVGLTDFHSPEVPSWDILKFPGTAKFLAINDNCDVYTSFQGTSKFNTDVWNGYCCPIAEGYVNDSSIDCKDVPAGKTCKTCAGQNTSMYPFNLDGAMPNSAKIFYHTCPTAYAYTYNDTSALFTCKGNTSYPSSYTVTLSCPGPVLVPTLTQKPLRLEAPDSSREEPLAAALVSLSGSAYEPISFIFSDFSRTGGSGAVSDTTIHHVHVNMTDDTGETLLKVVKNPSLGAIPGLAGHSFAIYYQIESPHLQPPEIESALIEFSVKESTLTSFGLTPEDIVLMHWDGSRWTGLPTVFDYSANGRAYFSATPPGFSFFVITEKRASAVSAISTTLAPTGMPSLDTATVVMTKNPVLQDTRQEVSPAASPSGMKTPANQSPAVLGTGSSPSISPLAVVLLVAGCCVAGGWYIRRWWIRRQNPALFRDMD